jgi:hypothetical protein
MSFKIFICYRRADKELARGIESRLAKEFGNESVFLDIDKIQGGQEWKKSISNAFVSKPIVVTLITTKWNSRRGGQFKLLDPEDHVRFELETALDLGLTVVPVVYGRAYHPKENQIPPSLHPMLEFQTLPFSNERYKYDLNQLVDAVRDLLIEKGVEVTIKTTDTVTELPTGPSQPNLNFTRSMFTLSPERKKEFAERAKKESERLARVRTESTTFYARPSFWIAIVITFVLSVGSIYGADILAQSFGKEMYHTNDPLIPGLIIASVWALVWITLGAASYRYDPELGAKIFYKRGILGGWTLGYNDFEPIGFWAAFPLSTGVLWLVARGLAILGFQFLNWDYSLIFWIVFGAYTLPVIIWYSIVTADEAL